MSEAPRDKNKIPTLLATSSVDGVTPVVVYADPTTHRLLVDVSGGVTTFIGLTDTPASYSGEALKILQVNAGETALEFITLAGGGDALTANPLSQFAATTSLQLKGVISDETGSGALVFGTSPTLVTPALGTPSALVATNATGTAASLTAGNVTTNANLTGHITSTGNATILGSFTVAQLNTALSDGTVGDVAGPASSTDNAVARFDSTTGKILLNSGVIISDTNDITGVGIITATDGAFTNEVLSNSFGPQSGNNLSFGTVSTGFVEIGNNTNPAILQSTGNQDITIKTGNATTGSISITDGANGNIDLSPNGTGSVAIAGTLFITEQAAAEADIAGKGQIWVDTATPNKLMFTDDAGSDFIMNDVSDNLKFIDFIVVAPATDVATGTGLVTWSAPFAGTIVQDDTNVDYFAAYTTTAGTTGTMVVDIHKNGATIMTTNKLDIETTELDTTTATTQPDLTTTTFVAGDIFTVDVDAIHSGTAAKGLLFRLPVRPD